MTHPVPTTLQPISPEDWPATINDLQAGFSGRLNVYRTMAHHPALLRAWGALRQHIVLDTSLGRLFSEIVILRAATHLKSPYEWNHHVSRALGLGISQDRIASMLDDLSTMAPDDAILARAVDDLLTLSRIGPDTLAPLMQLVGKEGVLDLMATVGFYSTLGFLLNTFDTPLDEAVASELSDCPLAR